MAKAASNIGMINMKYIKWDILKCFTKSHINIRKQSPIYTNKWRNAHKQQSPTFQHTSHACTEKRMSEYTYEPRIHARTRGSRLCVSVLNTVSRCSIRQENTFPLKRSRDIWYIALLLRTPLAEQVKMSRQQDPSASRARQWIFRILW